MYLEERVEHLEKQIEEKWVVFIPGTICWEDELFKINGNKTGTKWRDRSTPIRKAHQNPDEPVWRKRRK